MLFANVYGHSHSIGYLCGPMRNSYAKSAATQARSHTGMKRAKLDDSAHPRSLMLSSALEATVSARRDAFKRSEPYASIIQKDGTDVSESSGAVCKLHPPHWTRNS